MKQWPNNMILNSAERKALPLVWELSDTFDQVATEIFSNLPNPEDNKELNAVRIAVSKRGISLAMKPQVALGVIRFIGISPYWSTQPLLEESILALVRPLLNEPTLTKLDRCIWLDKKIRSVLGSA